MKKIVHIKIQDRYLNEHQKEIIRLSLKEHFDPREVLVMVTADNIDLKVYPFWIHWIKSLPIKIKLLTILKWKLFIDWWKQLRVVRIKE